ncbi:hypothetical protein [Pseudorhodoferax soli]|uniref:Uncharacterized protein n=1 Tax=Pseudorhodoferax soli TaxID=545864 RepID=A0A368Y0M4_9BURK|nr:hypothetical protein [Pseudorhodoferax soli]RCW73841.1 hypothetical protein DES41_102155 [Pseudorhodoferax soli]
MSTATVETPWHADLSEDQDNARKLAHASVCDIEHLCADLLERANDRLGSEELSDSAWCARIRMFATRIKDLNSLVMSHLDEDSVQLREAHRMVYGRFPHEGEAL